jgi:hypothetical protein
MYFVVVEILCQLIDGLAFRGGAADIAVQLLPKCLQHVIAATCCIGKFISQVIWEPICRCLRINESIL